MTATPNNHSDPVPSSSSWYDKNCYFLLPMLGWFLFSSLLSAYNKLLFGRRHNNNSDVEHNEESSSSSVFPCPLLLTSLGFCVQWIFAEVACGWHPQAHGGLTITKLTWREYVHSAVPCGLVTAADIAVTNLSWLTLNLTAHTLLKSSTPIFVLLWARVFGLVRMTLPLVAVIALITIGELITVWGQVQQKSGEFGWYGVGLCVAGAVLSGARWTLVQLKVHALKLPTTVATMRLLAPSMCVSLFVVSLLVERPWYNLAVVRLDTACVDLGLAVFSGVLAIGLVLCEFFIILKASAILLTVGGVLKDVLTIGVGIVFFGDAITVSTVAGCAVIFSGVLLYKSVHQHHSKQEEEEEEVPQPTHSGGNAQNNEKEAFLRSSQHQDKTSKRATENEGDSENRSIELV